MMSEFVILWELPLSEHLVDTTSRFVLDSVELARRKSLNEVPPCDRIVGRQ